MAMFKNKDEKNKLKYCAFFFRQTFFKKMKPESHPRTPK
jgi:hypothetical protein